AKFSAAKRRLDSLAAIEPRIAVVPRIPSLALRLARVATGALDGTFTAPNSRDWDLAAADLLVPEAGGLITTLTGDRLICNRSGPRRAGGGGARPSRAVARPHSRSAFRVRVIGPSGFRAVRYARCVAL